ncbi:MAG: NADH-quinone oxidoreductase subunit NuoK [Bdellovibrionales bacterium]|nr:NADH-quinone oxidoreductase subunit NuoK [Bdellovibrionales bacterium]
MIELGGLHSYLVVGAFLFCAGMACVLLKRNVIHMLMGIELIFNASAINFIAFDHFNSMELSGQLMSGQVMGLFVIVLAAAEAAVALALVLAMFQMIKTPNIDDMSKLKG